MAGEEKGIAEPHTQADRRHETHGASSLFSGGKTADEKKSKKYSLIGAIAGVLGIVIVIYLYERSKSGGAAATQAAGVPASNVPQGYVAGDGSGGGGTNGYADGWGSGQSSSPGQTGWTTGGGLGTTPQAGGGTVGGSHSLTQAATSATAAGNRYPVGTVVTGANSPFGLQSISQVLNLGGGRYVGVTSEGGLYGSGVNVSGSGFQKGTSGYSISQGPGNTIVESRSGQVVGRYSYK